MVSLFTSPAKAGWDAVKDTLVVASDAVSINIDTLTAFVYMESSFRGAVESKTSTATGLMQITNPTWRHLIRTYGPKHDLPRDVAKTNTVANVILGAEYFKENRKILAKRLGRWPTVLETYFAHKLGPDRAARLIRTSPSVKLVDFYPGAAKANSKVYFVDGRARTIGEFKRMFANRLSYALNTYGGMAVAYKDKIKSIENKERMNRWINELFYTDTSKIERLAKVSLQNYSGPFNYKTFATEDPGMDIYYATCPSGRKYNGMLI